MTVQSDSEVSDDSILSQDEMEEVVPHALSFMLDDLEDLE